jgi:hypothetical protein
VSGIFFCLQIFITDYFFKATLDENFHVADIEVIAVTIFGGLQTYVTIMEQMP